MRTKRCSFSIPQSTDSYGGHETKEEWLKDDIIKLFDYFYKEFKF